LKRHFGPSEAILKIQQKFHWRMNFPWGLFPQLLVAGAAIFLALTAK